MDWLAANPLLGASAALAAGWVGWSVYAQLPRSAPQQTTQVEAWQTLAKSFAKEDTLLEIRDQLIDEVLPWPK
jgi:hypothetical protein